MQDQIQDIERAGGCLCHGVRFKVSGAPLRVGICHCTDCRKSSGSTFSAFAIWPIDAFEQTGLVGTYGGRSFCPTCGGRVTSVRDDEVEVMIGSLDEAPTDLTPEYELWIGRRENWVLPLNGASQFDGDWDASANAAPSEPLPQPSREPGGPEPDAAQPD
jgi:hypothetical protein